MTPDGQRLRQRLATRNNPVSSNAVPSTTKHLYSLFLGPYMNSCLATRNNPGARHGTRSSLPCVCVCARARVRGRARVILCVIAWNSLPPLGTLRRPSEKRGRLAIPCTGPPSPWTSVLSRRASHLMPGDGLRRIESHIHSSAAQGRAAGAGSDPGKEGAGGFRRQHPVLRPGKPVFAAETFFPTGSGFSRQERVSAAKTGFPLDRRNRLPPRKRFRREKPAETVHALVDRGTGGRRRVCVCVCARARA